MIGRLRSATTGAALATLCAFSLSCSLWEDEDAAIEASGPLEARQVDVSAPSSARVLDVFVDEGEAVSAGDVVVELDAIVVEAQLAEATAVLEAARAELARVEEGSRTELIDAAEAMVTGAMARWDGARRAWQGTVKSRRAAADLGVESAELPDVVAAARQAYLQAEAEVDSANAALDALRGQPRVAELDVARSVVAQAEAAVEALEAQRDALRLRAPISGVVASRGLEPGELARAGAQAMRIADLSRMSLVVYVAEADLGAVGVGQGVDVTVDAFPDDVFRGKITRIAAEAEFTPRNVQTADERTSLVFAVEVSLDNGDGRLRAGMPALVTIQRP